MIERLVIQRLSDLDQCTSMQKRSILVVFPGVTGEGSAGRLIVRRNHFTRCTAPREVRNMSTIAQNKQAQLPGPDQNDSPDHIQRVQDELRAAGATLYGLAKFSSQYLHRLIHANEHIYGAVYGRYRGGRGILSLTEGMLVATDHRIIFLDYKPGFTAVEEIAYHAVAGIDYITAGPFSSVTLHTRIGEFSLRYANSNCIRHFVAYVETRQIDEREPRRMQSLAEGVPHDDAPTANSMPITPDTLTFLHDHNVAVLSTVTRNGHVHGAAVNYLFDMSGVLYILTKSTTRKAQNLLTNQQAALTIYDEGRLQTVQIHGRADREQ